MIRLERIGVVWCLVLTILCGVSTGCSSTDSPDATSLADVAKDIQVAEVGVQEVGAETRLAVDASRDMAPEIAGDDVEPEKDSVEPEEDIAEPGEVGDIPDCEAAATGSITWPEDNAQVSGPIVVQTTVADEDGISKVTIAVDTLQTCKFSHEFDTPVVSADVNIDVDLGSCGITEGSHELGLWMGDSCDNKELLDSVWVEVGSEPEGPCELTSKPPVGQWQDNYMANPDCTCSAELPDCHAIYVGQVKSLEGNKATLLFEKTDGGGPSEQVHYWVVVFAEEEMNCNLLDVYAVRAEGTWAPAEAKLEVTIDVWPNAADCEAAAKGEYKGFGLITGGSDGPDTKTWLTKLPIVFTKGEGGDEPCTEPTVFGVAPLTATLDQETVFTVTGECMPDTLAAWIGECEDLAYTSKTSTEAKFKCTPSWSTGMKDGVVKDAPGGNVLYEFKLDVK